MRVAARRVMRVLSGPAALFMLLSIGLPALAHDMSRRTDRPIVRADERAGGERLALDPDCFCWSEGRKVAHGQTACIRTPNGRRLALCDQVINMMSWSVTGEACPES